MGSGGETGEGERMKDEVQEQGLDPNRPFLTIWHWKRETPERFFF